MSEIDSGTLLVAYVTVVAPILGVLATIAFQIWQTRKERKQANEEEIRRRRISIISDLFEYRFVLANGVYSADAITNFNYALNRIPIEFFDHKEVLDLYREIGKGFTPEKFYKFLRLLMTAVKIDANLIDRNMVEEPPAATTVGFGIAAFTKAASVAEFVRFEVKASPKPET